MTITELGRHTLQVLKMNQKQFITHMCFEYEKLMGLFERGDTGVRGKLNQVAEKLIAEGIMVNPEDPENFEAGDWVFAQGYPNIF